MMGFAFGLGPVPWLFVGEIFPDRVKGVASATANMSNWLCAFVVTKFYPTVNETLGVHVSFWVFGACCLAGVAAVGLLFPETKGRSLDEIQEELAGRGRAKKGRENGPPATPGPPGPPEKKGEKVDVERRRYGSFDATSKV